MTVPPEPGKPDVVVSYVRFKGEVKRTQSDEYVEITNRGSAPADISGWVLAADAASPTFTFPPGTTLESSQAVRVYTNEVHAESGGFSYGVKRAIWNDRGDTATLHNADGALVSRLGYGDKRQPE